MWNGDDDKDDVGSDEEQAAMKDAGALELWSPCGDVQCLTAGSSRGH